ncbi:MULTISPECIES: GAP family protein [unclassified Arthrobacter]|uniref:GAP family protein n=1 Tax=unclassified Arthrobacter TaxID=235627 RepID=UPI000CE534B4|nr:MULTISPECIES: GAP family protein [unclassified Arthrobacter]
MLQALGHILPIAVASAVSSVPIMATIVILLSQNKRRSSVPYLIGWVLGIGIVVIGFTLLASVIPEPSPAGQQIVIGIAQIVIGLVLEAFAIIVWRRTRGKPAVDEPKWLATVGSLGPWSSFGLGFVLNLRPKSILLSAAVALSLRGSALTVGETAVVIAIYTALSATTVAIPVVGTLMSPEKTEAWLVSTRGWIARNNRTVTILILLMIGVVTVGNGLTRL